MQMEYRKKSLYPKSIDELPAKFALILFDTILLTNGIFSSISAVLISYNSFINQYLQRIELQAYLKIRVLPFGERRLA